MRAATCYLSTQKNLWNFFIEIERYDYDFICVLIKRFEAGAEFGIAFDSHCLPFLTCNFVDENR